MSPAPEGYADWLAASPRPPLPRTPVTVHGAGPVQITTLEQLVARERLTPREELMMRWHLSLHGFYRTQAWTVRLGGMFAKNANKSARP